MFMYVIFPTFFKNRNLVGLQIKNVKNVKRAVNKKLKSVFSFTIIYVTYLWSQSDRHFVGQHVVLCAVKW